MSWGVKLCICILTDLFDMTIGRVFFAGTGELVGCGVACSLFGWHGMWYGLEFIDFTEQLDGFVPTATIIALANRPQT
jgi:hypothetical protein